ncbi:MAG TPA: glycosyltransferase family A protein [Verrucomicrobiae bacterium]|nr:glycosyltransferase family A protein [Verrucomicrobiae bacterium]
MPETELNVTLVVPTLNRPQYLRTTLESVTAQNEESLEILVSDNGSSADTAKVVAEFQRRDHRIVARTNPETVDIITHWNQCLNLARGRYFMLLSDDDCLSRDYVRRLSNLMNQDPKIAVAFGKNLVIDRIGTVQRQAGGWNSGVYPGIDVVLDWLWLRRLPSETLLSMMVRTKAFREAGGFPSLYSGNNSDNAAFLALALEGFVAFDNTVTFSYRVYLESVGLACPWHYVARSARDMKRWFQDQCTQRRGFKSLSSVRQHELKAALNHMLEQQVLDRLFTVYRGRLGFFDWIRVPCSCGWEWRTVRTMLGGMGRLAKAHVREMLGTGPQRPT